MRRIFKYPLKITNLQDIEVYETADIVSVGLQRGAPFLWVMVNPEKRRHIIRIRTIGTGNIIEPDDQMLMTIGTYQIDGFVWHVFLELPI